MTFDNGTPANIAELARVSGLESVTAAAWLHCEEQEIDNPTNPLNVRYWGRLGQRLGPGANGAPGIGFAAYASAADGLDDAWAMLRSLAPSYGYGAVLAAAAGSDPIAEARAIEMSSWAAGHYGGSATGDGCLRTYVRAHVAAAPAGGVVDMIPLPITDTTPHYVDIDGPMTFYNQDGTPQPGTHGGQLNAYSPYVAGNGPHFYAIYAADADGSKHIILTRPTAPPRPVLAPAPAPVTADDPAVDAAELAAAVAAGSKAAVNAALDTIQTAIAAARPA